MHVCSTSTEAIAFMITYGFSAAVRYLLLGLITEVPLPCCLRVCSIHVLAYQLQFVLPCIGLMVTGRVVDVSHCVQHPGVK